MTLRTSRRKLPCGVCGGRGRVSASAHAPSGVNGAKDTGTPAERRAPAGRVEAVSATTGPRHAALTAHTAKPTSPKRTFPAVRSKSASCILAGAPLTASETTPPRSRLRVTAGDKGPISSPLQEAPARAPLSPQTRGQSPRDGGASSPRSPRGPEDRAAAAPGVSMAYLERAPRSAPLLGGSRSAAEGLRSWGGTLQPG